MMGLMGLTSPPGHAATRDEITRFEVEVVAGADGVLTVTQTIDVGFASWGHGPYLWFATTQAYDETRDRRITYSQFEITSPTKASVQMESGSDKDGTWVRVGDPNQNVWGTQTYVISYTVSGIINPSVAESGLDEIYWNVIGKGWTIPISNISVTIQGPANPVKTTCYSGADFEDPCTANSATDSVATFTQDSLRRGEGLAVVGGYPAGTYQGVDPDLMVHTAILEMTRLDIDATVGPDGVMSVRQTMDITSPDSNSSAMFDLETRQSVPQIPDRLISYSNLAVVMPGGPDPQLTVSAPKDQRDTLRVSFTLSETPGRTAQTYTLTYEISGLLDPILFSPMDNIKWNPWGKALYMPVSRTHVMIHGPGPIYSADCRLPDPYDCAHAVDESSATYTSAAVTAPRFFWVSAIWPAGTFPQARPHMASMNPFEIRYAGATPFIASLTALGAAGLVALIRRRGRDVVYANVAPGDTPPRRDRYRSSPRLVRIPLSRLGWAVCIVGFLAALVAGIIGGYLGVNGLGWFGISVVVLGVGIALSAKGMPVRTPKGSAAAVQAIGFRTYLETADADQIRWEEGKDSAGGSHSWSGSDSSSFSSGSSGDSGFSGGGGDGGVGDSGGGTW